MKKARITKQVRNQVNEMLDKMASSPGGHWTDVELAQLINYKPIRGTPNPHEALDAAGRRRANIAFMEGKLVKIYYKGGSRFYMLTEDWMQYQKRGFDNCWLIPQAIQRVAFRPNPLEQTRI